MRCTAASAASALGAANETLDVCTAATQAANRAANLAPKKEERRLLMRLLREAAYQTKTADTLLDQLSGVWAEVPVEAVRLKILELAPDFEEIIETTAGSTVTSHCGPGTLGVLFIRTK